MKTLAPLLLVLTSGWLFHGNPAWAENPPIPANTENPDDSSILGRLFNSPTNRILLDRLRQEGPPKLDEEKPDTTEEKEEEKAPVIRGPRYVSVSGIIFKENGPPEFWLNGEVLPTEKIYKGEGFTAFLDSATRDGLPIASEDAPEVFLVKPGETMDFIEKRVVATWKIPETELSSARREPPPPEGEGGKQTIPAKEKNDIPDQATPEKTKSPHAKKEKESPDIKPPEKSGATDGNDPLAKLSDMKLPPTLTGLPGVINVIKALQSLNSTNTPNTANSADTDEPADAAEHPGGQP